MFVVYKHENDHHRTPAIIHMPEWTGIQREKTAIYTTQQRDASPPKMYHLFRSSSTFNCPENFPKLQTIRWVFVMLPSLSIGLTSKYWKLGCQPSKTIRLICSKFVRSKKLSTWSSAWYLFEVVTHWNPLSSKRACLWPHECGNDLSKMVWLPFECKGKQKLWLWHVTAKYMGRKGSSNSLLK